MHAVKGQHVQEYMYICYIQCAASARNRRLINLRVQIIKEALVAFDRSRHLSLHTTALRTDKGGLGSS